MEPKVDKGVGRKRPSVLLMDLGKVILFSKENLPGKMNPRHRQLSEELGKDYPFFDYFGVNENLLDFLESIKAEYRIYMITEGHIQDQPLLHEKLGRVFEDENIISSGDLELDKKKEEAYEYLKEKLGVKPGEIVFVDDNPDNINAASMVGLLTIQSETEEQVIADLKGVLGIES